MTDIERVETDNIAVMQARALKKYCLNHEECCGCVFYGYDEEGRPVCKIAPTNEQYTILCPMDWEV